MQTSQGKLHNDLLTRIQETANENIAIVFDALDIEYNGEITHADEIRCACPIHGGDNDTAFSYDKRKMYWRCFTGHCHEQYKNNIFGLVQAVLSNKHGRRVSFYDAVYWLAALLNVSIVDPSNASAASLNEIEVSRIVSENRRRSTPHFVKTRFDPIPIASVAARWKPSEFFLKQGFTVETLKRFYVSDCHSVGKPMYYRAFTPVLDDTGQYMIGVTGRTLLSQCHVCGQYHQIGFPCPTDSAKTRSYPKWYHYGFSASSTLYNIWDAKRYIAKSKVAVLAEGPKDVWWMHQCGMRNIVSLFGTNADLGQIKKLIRYGTVAIAVALDNDNGGINGAEHIIETLSQYFAVIDISQLYDYSKDLADLSPEEIQNTIIPAVSNIEKRYGEQ